MTNYGKIFQLGHKWVSDILEGKVLIEEKIDGSQFSFGVRDGKLWADSHHQHLNLSVGEDGRFTDIPNLFLDAVAYIHTLFSKGLLREGWTYRGEVLSKPKHNIIQYDRVPRHNIVIFDVDKGNQDYMEYNDKINEALRLDLECVPQHFFGWVPNRESIDTLLQRQPLLGGKLMEGIVIKAYDKLNDDGKVKMCKLVNSAFKEIAKTDQNPFHVQKDTAHHIGKQYGTVARWNKAIQRLEESGKGAGDMCDMPILMKDVDADIMAEAGEEIKEQLLKRYRKEIFGAAKAGLAEHYKKYLIDKALSAAKPQPITDAELKEAAQVIYEGSDADEGVGG